MARHPPYKEMTIAAITNLKERSGSSRQSIAKYVVSNYTVTDTYEMYLKQALKRLVKQKVLLQTKGSGASGSFKINPTSKIAPSKDKKAKGTVDSAVAGEQEATDSASTAESGDESEKKGGAVKKLNFEEIGGEEEPGSKKGASKEVKFVAKTESPVAKKGGGRRRHTVYEDPEVSEAEETIPKGKTLRNKKRQQK